MIRLLINLLVFGFCAVYLLTNFKNIVDELQHVHFFAWRMVLAFLLTWAVDGLGAVAWWLLLLGFNQRVNWLESWRSHLKSVVAKYIPGFVWQYLGKGYLTRQMGVPSRVISILIVWELIQLLWAGSGIGLLFAPASILAERNLPGWVQPVMTVTGGVLLLGLFIFPFAAGKLLRRRSNADLNLHGGYLLLSALITSGAWILLGIGLRLTATAFGPVPLDNSFFVFTFTSSLIAGLIAIPVPNGIGVREGLMAFLLGHFVAGPLAALIAAINRLELVTGEFVCLLVIEAVHWIRAR